MSNYQTKLVNCGGTTFVYDYRSSRKIKELGFEKVPFEGAMVYLKRLLLTNFLEGSGLASFKLNIPLGECDQIQNKLDHFIKSLRRSSGHSHIKYLAVLDLPLKESDNNTTIHLITDVKDYEHTIALRESYCDEFVEEDYFEKVWGNQVLINYDSPEGLMNTFAEAYRKSITHKNSMSQLKQLFHNKLKQPLVLWNEEADAFIKAQKLLDYPKYKTAQIYDKIGGWITINEYSIK